MKNLDFDVHLIEKEDIPRFVELWNQGYQVLTSGKSKMTLDKALKGYHQKMFTYYGLFKNNNLIGFALLTDHSGNIWLKHILIDQEYRNKKLGTLFIEEMFKIAVKKGKKLTVEVLKQNPKALKFFSERKFRILKFDKKENQYILEKA